MDPEIPTMFGLALLSVSLWTFRVSITTRGLKLASAAMAAVKAKEDLDHASHRDPLCETGASRAPVLDQGDQTGHRVGWVAGSELQAGEREARHADDECRPTLLGEIDRPLEQGDGRFRIVVGERLTFGVLDPGSARQRTIGPDEPSRLRSRHACRVGVVGWMALAARDE